VRHIIAQKANYLSGVSQPSDSTTG
jgi:hypothetical protein